MVLGLENYNFIKKLHKLWKNRFSNKIYLYNYKNILNNISKVIKYYYIYIYSIILFIVILMMIYDLLPYFRKMTKNN